MARDPGFIWHRFKLDYFGRRPNFRAIKFGLGVACAVLAAVWVAVAGVRSDHWAFSSGEMSAGHRMLADQCQKCHTEGWHSFKGLFGSPEADQAMNRACLECHSATIGYDASSAVAYHQSGDPDRPVAEPWTACATCHEEHEGSQRLNAVTDANCVRCHADLVDMVKETGFQAQISAFSEDHPEFRVLDRREPDQGRIALNHELHLKPLRGPDGAMVQMTCADCHRAGLSGAPWPYGTPNLHEADGVTSAVSEPQLQAAYMEPIRYSLHCKSCHELIVDASGERIPERAIPHETPRAIRTFLRGRLTEFADLNSKAFESIDRPSGGERFTLRDLPPKEGELLKTKWVKEQVALLERMVYVNAKHCTKCHEYSAERDADGLPVIAPPNIPRRWFAHASFDHERHRTIDCLECHAHTSASKTTSDVLLPGIDTCRACHAPRTGRGESATGGVPDNCALCHTYHRPQHGTMERPNRSIRDIIGQSDIIGNKTAMSR